MKSIYDPKKNNAMAEIRKNKNFSLYSKSAKTRTMLAIKIFELREKIGISQQELAKMVNTSQKVISKIENAEVNLGIDLFTRLMNTLNYKIEDIAEVFNLNLNWWDTKIDKRHTLDIKNIPETQKTTVAVNATHANN